MVSSSLITNSGNVGYSFLVANGGDSGKTTLVKPQRQSQQLNKLQQTIAAWQKVFLLASACMAAGTLTLTLFAMADVQGDNSIALKKGPEKGPKMGPKVN